MCTETLRVYLCHHQLPYPTFSTLNKCALAEYKGVQCPPENTRLFLTRHDYESCDKCNPFKDHFGEESKHSVENGAEVNIGESKEDSDNGTKEGNEVSGYENVGKKDYWDRNSEEYNRIKKELWAYVFRD